MAVMGLSNTSKPEHEMKTDKYLKFVLTFYEQVLNLDHQTI